MWYMCVCGSNTSLGIKGYTRVGANKQKEGTVEKLCSAGNTDLKEALKK